MVITPANGSGWLASSLVGYYPGHVTCISRATNNQSNESHRSHTKVPNRRTKFSIYSVYNVQNCRCCKCPTAFVHAPTTGNGPNLPSNSSPPGFGLGKPVICSRRPMAFLLEVVGDCRDNGIFKMMMILTTIAFCENLLGDPRQS